MATRVALAYRKFLNARTKRSGAAPTVETAQPIWRAVASALRAYQMPTETAPFPKEIAAFIADELEILLNGQMPDNFAKLLRRGQRRSPAQNDDKRVACMYWRAAKRGPLRTAMADKNPDETIARWFGISDDENRGRTLRRWRADKSLGDTAPSKFLPDETLEIRANLLKELARKSGEHWRKFYAHTHGGLSKAGRVKPV